jgi:type II secretion system protein I
VKTRAHSNAACRDGSGSAGFTLPEILIAVAILAIGIVAVLEAFNGSLSALSASRDAIKANLLIMDKMAETELSAISQGMLDTGASNGSFEGENASYRWECSVEGLSARSAAVSDASTLNRIDLAVWREGYSRRYSVSTYLMVTRKQ